MKAVILNGMEAGDTLMESVQDILADVLREENWETQIFTLHEMEIAPCMGCFGCWLQTPGRCIRADTDAITRACVQSELLVFLTPITFGGYSPELKKAVDRLIPIILPFFEMLNGETHHKPRYDRYPNLLAVGVLPHPDQESEQVFTTLVAHNATNFWAPAHAVGVVTRERSAESIRHKIQTSLAQVEVTQ
jgi:multimeric flavodoxin WrbA